MLGKLLRFVIGHDGSGILPASFFGKAVAAAWYLEKCELIDQTTGATYKVPCSQWFDKKKGDGKAERKLVAQYVDPRDRH